MRNGQDPPDEVVPVLHGEKPKCAHANLCVIGTGQYKVSDFRAATSWRINATCPGPDNPVSRQVPIQGGGDVTSVARAEDGDADYFWILYVDTQVGHLSSTHAVTLSEREGPPTAWLERLADELRTAGVKVIVDSNGFHALWNKGMRLITPTATTAANCGLGALVGSPDACKRPHS